MNFYKWLSTASLQILPLVLTPVTHFQCAIVLVSYNAYLPLPLLALAECSRGLQTFNNWWRV